jgi:hypothetical protein
MQFGHPPFLNALTYGTADIRTTDICLHETGRPLNLTYIKKELMSSSEL